MAKHRKRRRPHLTPVVVAGATAGMSTVLALGHATNATAATIPTADTVIGVGGWTDTTSARIRDKFQGKLVPTGQDFVGVQYPAQLPVDPSVAEGQAPLGEAVDGAAGSVLIVGYSEGSLVAEQYKRALVAAGAPNSGNIAFLFIAAPTVPNGGIYSRFPDLRIPGFTSTGAAAPSPYDETFVTLEYDLIADFPAYANPLSLANAVLGLAYFHGDQGPDNVDLENAPQSVKVVTSEAGGTDTYVLIRAVNLPLLQPIRDVAALTGTAAVVEPFVGAVEPTLRLLVDMGYTDRDYRTIGVDEQADYQDADRPTPFSVFTPADRIVETANALPDALRDGAQNVTGALPAAPTTPTTKTAKTTGSDARKQAADSEDDSDGKTNVKRNTLLRKVFGGVTPKRGSGTAPAADPEPSPQAESAGTAAEPNDAPAA
ncbi:PE-PPE domain-containing protein [Mycolicibacterium baixiangningiae]|uniref:PE-PPE domain-containing protein n=1 Tax=Mycolicibacterium baixiangningiae TaxID=2761578 RepID=UPI0018D0C962|nr:PE-PPE domain-containing protein [Mycolicibacterium baixiangningiae]